MNQVSIQLKRVLAIDPTTRGFGFAILEGPANLIDWGVKEARDNKEDRSLEQIDHLIHHYQPDVVVVEDCNEKGSRRCIRVQKLIGEIITLVSEKKVKVHALSKLEVKEVFSLFGAATKQEIATAIAKEFPELSPRIPPHRKCYMSEDYRMSIFDAMALAMTYFHFTEKDEMAAHLSNF